MSNQTKNLIVDKATSLMKSSLFFEAIELINSSIKIDKADFQLYFLLGTSYLQINNLDLAELNLAKSVKLNENFSGAAHNLGVVLNLKKKFFDAKIQFFNALKIKPDNLDTLIELGRTYQFLDDFSLAKKYYENALKIDPGNKKANGLLGKMNLNNGFHKQGLICLQRVQGFIRIYDESFEII